MVSVTSECRDQIHVSDAGGRITAKPDTMESGNTKSFGAETEGWGAKSKFPNTALFAPN